MKLIVLLMLAASILFVANVSASTDRCTSPQTLNSRFNKIACKAAHSAGFYNDYDSAASLCVKHTVTRRLCTSERNHRYIDATVSYGRNSGQVSRGTTRYDDRADCRVYLTASGDFAGAVDCSIAD